MGCGSSAGKSYKADADSTVKPADGSASSSRSVDVSIAVANAGKLEDFYDLAEKKLGKSSYSRVVQGSSKDGTPVAVQTIPKRKVKNVTRLNQELTILSPLDNQYICKLLDSFQDHMNVYLVFELLSGGDLFDRVTKQEKFYEWEASIIMQQLFSALTYLHSQNVAHLDLKPENCLFSSKAKISQTAAEGPSLKIIDFDNACPFEPGKKVDHRIGPPYFMEADQDKATKVTGHEVRQNDVAQHESTTKILHKSKVSAYYVAPEVVGSRRGFTETVDCWSAGVIMYILLCGYPPFPGDKDEDVHHRAAKDKPAFSGWQWTTVSSTATSLIEQLLEKDGRKRITSQQALESQWIVDKAVLNDRDPFPSSVAENLQNFWAHSHLKKAALKFIAANMEESDIEELKVAFEKLDINGDGTVTRKELKEGMNQVSVKHGRLDFQAIFAEVSSSTGGNIDYHDFLSAAINERKYLHQELIWKAFKEFDTNGDGKLTKGEVMEAAKKGQFKEISTFDIEKFLNEIDTDGDGKIDFTEFLKLVRD